MKAKESSPSSAPLAGALLGIEGGGTRTVALLVADGQAPITARFGPANLRLLSDTELVARFSEIQSALGLAGDSLAGLAIGMAGARTEGDRQRIRDAAAKIWPGVSCYATNDLETAILAANREDARSTLARVLILSGTGSCCFGRDATGKTVRFGGWGHVLGDGGSGYDVGLRALRAVIYELDLSDKWPLLGQRILRTAQLNEPIDLVDWAKNADKTRIASLAPVVFEAAADGDRIAARIVAEVAAELARDGAHCARRTVKGNGPIEFVLAGGLFKNQPSFVKRVRAHLLKLRPGAMVRTLERESVWGAIELARQHFGRIETVAPTIQAAAARTQTVAIPAALQMSPTEERNPRSLDLDQLPLSEAIELFAHEDSSIPQAVLGQKAEIERAIKTVIRAFKAGGRLFYAGAGTSGRLGVLDASEIPPTFRSNPDLVQGIMAGGYEALWSSVEGAEDDPAAGAAAIEYRGVNAADVVIGIAASGRTPFVWGALDAARKIGAATVLLCFNPHLKFAPGRRPKIVIAPNVGPEILTGSTRLKAGTATKLVLNMITTLAMVRMGKVRSNLMIDVNPSNLKLRDRAVRIVQAVAGVDRTMAEQSLEASGWMVKAACDALTSR